MLYTDEERAVIKRMYIAGAKYSEIGAVLGRSEKSIEDQRCKMGLPRRDGPAPTRRDRTDRSAPPITFTAQELNRAERYRRHCCEHLVDLMRAYGGGTLGDAKLRYTRSNELDIPPGSERTLILATGLSLSAWSSPAGWMS